MSKKVNPTYSEAFAEIEEIVEQIENSELNIDDLSEKVKRVSFLIKICKDKLFATESEIEKLLKNID